MNINDARKKVIGKIEIAAGMILATSGIAILSSNWVDNLFLTVISFLKGRPPVPHWLVYLHLIGATTTVTGAVFIGLFILPYWDRLKQSKFGLHLSLKWDRVKQSKIAILLAPISGIIFIWILITIEMFSFSFLGNESDILPSILQFVNHDWLPSDWYLNLNIGYRQLFDIIFGPLVSHFGFVNGAYLGRLIEYLLLAIAIYYLFKTLRLRYIYGMLVLLLFLNFQSFVAGEWVVSGLDTKTIAYALAFLSFSFIYRKRYLIGFAFAGAAISFHVLIGIYASFCIVIAALLNKSWRSEWRQLFINIWPIFITGIFGIWAVIEQLLPSNGIDLNKAWGIYVYYRVPNHVMPFTWTIVPWEAELTLATCFFLIMFFLSRSKPIRFAAAFALGSVSLFLIGLVIYAYRDLHLLSFYWFRFPDAMVPFISFVLIALFLNNFAFSNPLKHPLMQRFQIGVQAILRLLPPIIVAFIIVVLVQQSSRLQTSYKDLLYDEPGTILPAFDWISKNTPKQAIILVDPTK